MKKYLLLSLSLLLSCGILLAQERSVSGVVTDAETGEALPGVNVILQGTSSGTVTDFDGKFTVTVPGDNAVLLFSFVGYQTSEITVGSRSVIDVSLGLDVTELSEVVVVGYGTQEKKEITSAVASVSAEEFNQGTVNDPVQLLQGKVAGLNITRPGGDPNGGFNIRLRGVSTVGANSSPLIVIDGVIGGSLSTIDPNDIASIDVLKDGSAAAIYGSRGSSGVILVTTKSGKAGRMTVNYNGSFAAEQVANTIDYMSAEEFVAVGGTDLGSDTDWLEEVTRTGMTQVHNLSVSGGTAQTSYRASVNYRDAEGVGVRTGFEQVNGRLNLTQRALNDRAKIEVGLSATTKEAKYGFAEAFRYAVTANPTLPVLDPGLADDAIENGNFGGYAERQIFDFFNPVSIIQQNQNEGTDTRLLASIRGEYDFSDFVEGLSASVFYSRQEEHDVRAQYFAKTAKFRGANRNGWAFRSEDRRFNELFESTLNYTNNFGDLNAAFLGGYSYQEFFFEGFNMDGGDFTTDAFTYNNIGAALDFANGLGNVGSYANSYKLVAFFGRLNLNYDDSFFLSASARYEGSTRFGENNQWGLFPAASLGVNLTNLVDIPQIDNLKLRASYGRTGNIPGDSYLSLQRFGATGSNFFFNGAYVPSFGPVSNPNPDLQWETKDEYDIGFDFVALGSRLRGTFDWYIRYTEDMILEVNVPVPPNQFATTFVNIGKFQNSGFEVALNYDVIKTSDFTWTTGINASTFSTEVTSLTSGDLSFGEGGVLFQANMGAPGQNDTRLVRVKEGEELGQLWGPIQEGVNEDGTPRFADLSGDGTYCNCDDDFTVIGSGLPDVTGGWSNTITYKGWDVNIFFRGAFGHDLLNSYRGFYENTSATTLGNFNVVNSEYFDPNLSAARVSSIHVENADYILLDNATIGYTVPLNSENIKKLRFYASVQRPFVITDYSGVDPTERFEDKNDSDNGGFAELDGNPLAPGIERRSTYFTTRTLTVGVNLQF